MLCRWSSMDDALDCRANELLLSLHVTRPGQSATRVLMATAHQPKDRWRTVVHIQLSSLTWGWDSDVNRVWWGLRRLVTAVWISFMYVCLQLTIEACSSWRRRRIKKRSFEIQRQFHWSVICSCQSIAGGRHFNLSQVPWPYVSPSRLRFRVPFYL